MCREEEQGMVPAKHMVTLDVCGGFQEVSKPRRAVESKSAA